LERHDLVVVGAGSGGIGAAVAAGRLGLDVLLVERAPTIGGNVVRAGVSVWEMGVGGTGLPFEIYRRLRCIPDAVGVYSIGRHCLWPSPDEYRPYPGGESLIDRSKRYEDSLRRFGARSMALDEAFCRQHWHGVPFEPAAYAWVVARMLREAGCTVITGQRFRDVKIVNGLVEFISLEDRGQVAARTFIDATGNGALGEACGAELLTGQESRDAYDEPHAPKRRSNRVNGTTLIYRVCSADELRVGRLLPGVPSDCWWREAFPVASIVQYPCGDLNINMLPTMEGGETQELGEEMAWHECRRRVSAHWHHLQSEYEEFRSYRMAWIAPELGIRESRRVLGEYVLNEHDLLAGIERQRHHDVVAIADHAMDVHGAGGACGELSVPYGIPYRSLVPKGSSNVLMASRAASFTAIAASSCRLSRTMMQLGQAAGSASWLAQRLGVDVCDVPSDRLRDLLRAQHVQLQWPMPEQLASHLEGDNCDWQAGATTVPSSD